MDFRGDNSIRIQNDYDKEVYDGDIGYVDEVETTKLLAGFDGGAVQVLRSANSTRWYLFPRPAKATEPRSSGHDAALRHAATKSTLCGVTRQVSGVVS